MKVKGALMGVGRGWKRAHISHPAGDSFSQEKPLGDGVEGIIADIRGGYMKRVEKRKVFDSGDAEWIYERKY